MARTDAADLERFATRVVAATGADERVAETVAASLVGSDLRGHPSHGVQLLPDYVLWADAHLDPGASPEVVADQGAILRVDGNHAFGHHVCREAVETAVDRVEDGHPSVTVGVGRATHIGRVGWFAEQAAAAGLGFQAWTTITSGEPVAPAGSAQRRFGTNPLTVGLPSFDALPHPVVLDIATSQVAYGKVNVRQMAGKSVDPAWTADAAGDPVTDPDRFNDGEAGALLPLGGETAGYKGTGMAVMADLLAATWSDGPVTAQPESMYENATVFTVFDPLAFTTQEAHEARLTATADYLAETEPAQGVDAGAATDYDRAVMPGRPEHDTKRAYEREGIPVPEGVRESLAAFARDLGLDDEVVDLVA